MKNDLVPMGIDALRLLDVRRSNNSKPEIFFNYLETKQSIKCYN